MKLLPCEFTRSAEEVVSLILAPVSRRLLCNTSTLKLVPVPVSRRLSYFTPDQHISDSCQTSQDLNRARWSCIAYIVNRSSGFLEYACLYTVGIFSSAPVYRCLLDSCETSQSCLESHESTLELCRDGKSMKYSTDEYFSKKKQHKKRVFRDILQFAPKQRKFP